MANQFDLNKFNTVMSQASDAILCNSDCKRKREAEKLKQNYQNAQTNLASASNQVQVAQKNYVTFTQGTPAYNELQDNQLQQQAQIIADKFNENFNEETVKIRSQINTYNGLLINFKNIFDLERKYRKDMNFDEIHIDTHSFLMTKIDKFKPAKEKKAYSYFGTICKNYLMGQIMKDQKETNRKISYEDISSDLQHSPDMIYHIDDDSLTTEEIIKKFLIKLKDSMGEKAITEQEVKLGQALYDIFENYNDIFLDTSNNKFNKNVILFELREMTNLSTKEIRTSIKRFKKVYFQLVQELLK
jgi:hypothetical protein